MQFYTENGRFKFSFWAPNDGLKDRYDVYLGLIGKRVVDFLLALIEIFPLGVTAEVLRANIGWKSAFSLQRSQLQTFQAYTEKTRLGYSLDLWVAAVKSTY